ncbi:MAG: hypothetical protein A2600_02595 [Candidatus Lambdaproteobacteria bacterium RIFOXYD1_FULL_56_27]|uniref:tRNA-dihydrouridine synthase n=1 Tax=Candidatus Lambdaproteobacteria bacterium RIFOXYD2_FULL_56_26 TaxID=1817773 RepID=A0A1F6H2V6_9PROT|nr:MAG: hypothetical protein A2426_09635 [Candidatus Lambdaproteobacteria bacterium RIFOXYC1_FULL_56_13]OGH04666.1 MAG: hypothetical protein A2557_06660 [Candidatus Lambdaproteobacteria bacterium RIFOXYD2_FULL_56_26]OGH09130.1 MAG: hypothetical protein A2600_02595 [Candidatus Lambdaproteobacteria bacterium RIFOXYD1_FULL_56_27]
MTKLQNLPRPLMALAPMDGVTDRAFRQIVRKLNPGVLLYSEFTNVNGIVHSSKVRERLLFEGAELPYVVQIFGRDPLLFAQIAREVQDLGITGIDINLGCPSKRVVSGGNGAALIKEPDLAFAIVEATAKATALPVTVKTRLGWADASTLVGFAKGLESAGASLITVHGRTAKMAYRGEADWEPIYELKKELKIPVLGNGDLRSLEQGMEQLKDLDGFMIGRAAVGNPWVFWPQEQRDKLTLKDKVDVMLEHFTLLRRYQSEHKTLVEFRKHLGGYLSGFRDAKALRRELMETQTEQDFTLAALRLAS